MPNLAQMITDAVRSNAPAIAQIIMGAEATQTRARNTVAAATRRRGRPAAAPTATAAAPRRRGRPATAKTEQPYFAQVRGTTGWPMTRDEMCTACSWNPNEFNARIPHLLKARVLKQNANGTYELVQRRQRQQKMAA